MKTMPGTKMFLFQIVIMISLSSTVLGQTARMITYNIRYDNPNDGENIWENRKNKMAGLINYYEPSFLGIQEGLLNQVDDRRDNNLHVSDHQPVLMIIDLTPTN